MSNEKTERNKEIYEEIESGKKQTEVADSLGIRKQAVNKIYHREKKKRQRTSKPKWYEVLFFWRR